MLSSPEESDSAKGKTTEWSVHGNTLDLNDIIINLTKNVHRAGSCSGAVLSELETLARGIVGVKQSLETGCGRTTVMLSNISRKHLCFCIDDRNIQQHNRSTTSSVCFAIDNTYFNQDRVSFVFGPTQRTIRNYEFGETLLDFVFLDGPHAFPFVEMEYYFLYPHIRHGGILGIDDIQIPNIANLFRFLRDDAMWNLISVVENTAFFERTKAPTFDPEGDYWKGQGYNALRVPAHPILMRNIYIKHIQPWLKYLPANLKARLKHVLLRH